MKIKYEFINGETTEIEVDENIGTFILDSRRNEENLARKERYHCYSSDVAWEGEDYADSDTPETILFKKMRSERIKKALSKLSDVQRRRLLMHIDGLNYSEIARIEEVNHSAVKKSVESAKKIFLKNF